jgi:hypothetical protein
MDIVVVDSGVVGGEQKAVLHVVALLPKYINKVQINVHRFNLPTYVL